MDGFPIFYLHLETAVLPIFIAQILWFQLARASDPGYFIPSGRIQMLWLVSSFVVMALVFGGLLLNVSPLLALELAAGFTLSLLHPVNALCFFVHLLLLRPWEIVTTHPLLLALPRLAGLLCVFSWLLHPDLHAQPNRRAQKGLLLVLAYSGWLFLTTFGTPNIAESQMNWFGTYFKSLVVFIMCLFFIEGRRSILQFQITLVISALALMLVGYVHFRSEGNLTRLESFGNFGDSNDAAALVVLTLPMALFPLLRHGVHVGRQAAGLLYSAFSVLVVWLTRSRGAMLAIVTQAMTVGWLRSSQKQWFKLLLFIGLLTGGYLMALQAIPRQSEEMGASSESRLTYWKAAVNMTVHHPLLGVGFDQYPDNYETYSSGTRYEWGRRTAHSSWFLAFAESGIIGGMLFIAFFCFALKTAWRNRSDWPEQLCAIVGYAVAMSFLSHTYGMEIFLLAGLILASDAVREDAYVR